MANHIVLDREVDIGIGRTYELVVWHTDADTLETRTLGSETGITITVSPSAAFDFAVAKGDRWALGISSEDLMTATIVEINRDELGRHIVVAQEYQPTFFQLDCPSSIVAVTSNASPSQPSSVNLSTSDNCALCIDVVTAVSCEGSLLVSQGASISEVNLADIHHVNDDALISEFINIVDGVASGDRTVIVDWDATSNIAFISPSFTTAPDSGDAYFVEFKGVPFGGFEVDLLQGTRYGTGNYGAGFYGRGPSEFNIVGAIFGTSGCFNIQDFGAEVDIRITPFSNRGVRNTNGRFTTSITALGCASFNVITTGQTVSGLSLVNYFTAVLPSNTVGTRNRVTMEIHGLVSEVCSPLETTELSLNLEFGGQQIVQSMLITLSDTDTGGVGSETPSLIEVDLSGEGVTSKQSGFLTFRGQTVNGFQEIQRSGTGTVDSTLPQTLSVTAIFQHRDEFFVQHPSHPCFFMTFESAVTEVMTL